MSNHSTHIQNYLVCELFEYRWYFYKKVTVASTLGCLPGRFVPFFLLNIIGLRGSSMWCFSTSGKAGSPPASGGPLELIKPLIVILPTTQLGQWLASDMWKETLSCGQLQGDTSGKCFLTRNKKHVNTFFSASELRCRKRWWWSYCSHFTTMRGIPYRK